MIVEKETLLYIEEAKLRTLRIANSFYDVILLSNAETELQDIIDFEIEYEIDSNNENGGCDMDNHCRRLQALHRMKRRSHAFFEALQSFLDDVRILCTPESEVQA